MAQLAQAGRLLLSPFTSVAGWYNRTAQSYPFTVGVVTTGLKTSAADVFAQKVRTWRSRPHGHDADQQLPAGAWSPVRQSRRVFAFQAPSRFHPRRRRAGPERGVPHPASCPVVLG